MTVFQETSDQLLMSIWMFVLEPVAVLLRFMARPEMLTGSG